LTTIDENGYIQIDKKQACTDRARIFRAVNRDIVEDPTLGCSRPLWICGGKIKACTAQILEETEEEEQEDGIA
jgi:hypothetical protein